ncbi:hypothetical protein RBSWK_05512 [Rhodopirellula baltica SWK14]|uniref:Uncharacterized protein n=1 Tax=Rhodopirellula baltica SWK14 TaxID=993516 RepID=L7C9S9_RHOBT|nr:hypothetical protein RBSWK_05512 [Rhodopirellula baltica SWK14]
MPPNCTMGVGLDDWRHSKFELFVNVRADRRLENVFDSS